MFHNNPSESTFSLPSLILSIADNSQGSTSASQQFFQMSGDGVEDVRIPVLFLFFAEGAQFLSLLTKNRLADVYLGISPLSG